MAFTSAWPGVNGLPTTTDARKALAGLIAKDAAGVARSGVFPAHTNALITARTDMNVDIAAFTAASVQFGGPNLFTNDGVAQLPSVLVSPGAGTNYYVIYAKQNESTTPGTDANNNRAFGAQLSTTSLAAARALLPAGALELGTVEIPTGKTATNQAGVVITQTARFTAAQGGMVLLRSATEESAWAPHDGATAYRVDTDTPLVRIDGAWKRINSGQNLITAGTFTGVNNVPLDGLFSTAFSDYTLEFDIDTIAAVSLLYARLRAGGSATTSGYYYELMYGAASAAGAAPGANVGRWQLTTQSGDQAKVRIELANPADPRRAMGLVLAQGWDSTTGGTPMGVAAAGISHGSPSAYDGFEIQTAAAQLMSGRYRIYGHYAG